MRYSSKRTASVPMPALRVGAIVLRYRHLQYPPFFRQVCHTLQVKFNPTSCRYSFKTATISNQVRLVQQQKWGQFNLAVKTSLLLFAVLKTGLLRYATVLESKYMKYTGFVTSVNRYTKGLFVRIPLIYQCETGRAEFIRPNKISCGCALTNNIKQNKLNQIDFGHNYWSNMAKSCDKRT